MKHILLVLIIAVATFESCQQRETAKFFVNKEGTGGYLFVDAIDGVRTTNENEFTLKPGIHKIVYSTSQADGIFAPTRTEFFIATLELKYPTDYTFSFSQDVLNNGKVIFTVAELTNSGSVIKQWTETEKVPFKF